MLLLHLSTTGNTFPGTLWNFLGKLLPVLVFTGAAPRRVSAGSGNKKGLPAKGKSKEQGLDALGLGA